MKKPFVLIIFFLTTTILAQENWNQLIDGKLNSVIARHRTFVSIPNLPSDIQKMYENVSWVKQQYKTLMLGVVKDKTINNEKNS